mmetsp:Transcript_840/g.1162  ORF Transcript_840/g.1162 Transcript_840/m.1162 type:complete len:482 (-) Transcript_840:94-1539(-)
MPFVTKNPAHYLKALAEDSAEALHIGLFFSRSISEQQAADLIKLAKAIQQSTRTIRCLWLRFRDGDESICAALQAFGDELAGDVSIQSLVVEGKAGPAEIECLAGFFRNNKLRGLQFRRTDIDASAAAVLRPLFVGSATLNVLDLSQNSKLGDVFVEDMLTALSEGETSIETLSIGECDIDAADDNDETIERISATSVELMARYVSRSKSLSSVTLRLLNLDDIGIGELANVLKRQDCSVRRLDLGGNFGNNGIKILAEALKTNQSIKTITLGCHKNLNDVGAQELLRVSDPFAYTTHANKKTEWDSVKKSNHSLQSVYILDRPSVTVSNELVTKLRSISSLQPHQTLQTKAWHHIEKHIEDISHMEIDNKYVPEVMSFVQKRGELNGLFETIRSSNSLKIFENPSPERARLSDQMDRIQKENAILKRLLKAERERSQSLRNDNYAVRKTVEMKFGKKCPSWNSCKQLWLEVVDLIKEPIW